MRAILLGLFIFSGLFLRSQGGAHVHAGLIKGFNNIASITPEGHAHYGFLIGVDARLNDGGMYFLAGMQYVKLGFNATSSSDFFNPDPSFQVIKGRFGFGFLLVQFGNSIDLRAKFLGSVSYINSISDDAVIPVPYEKFNEAFGGIDIGVGISLNAFTLDFEYELGLVNAVYEAKDSKFDLWTLTIGFFF